MHQKLNQTIKYLQQIKILHVTFLHVANAKSMENKDNQHGSQHQHDELPTPISKKNKYTTN